MKKTVLILLCIFLTSFMPISTHAEEHNDIIIMSGYTVGGVYYEVYGEIPILSLRSGEEINVTRTVTYSGKVTPQRQLPWQESINGIVYTGTLNLSRKDYNPDTNKTVAVYVGTLAPKN